MNPLLNMDIEQRSFIALGMAREWLKGNGRRQILLLGDEHGFIVQATEFGIEKADSAPCEVASNPDLARAMVSALEGL
jgi:hypothetical protein